MDRVDFVPTHLGLIMDGNGRWAEERGLPRKDGHTAGMVNMISLAAHAFDMGVKTVTCYSMSTENLNRSKDEVDHILSLVLKYFEPFLEEFRKKKVCAKFVGQLDLVPPEIRASLKRTEELLSEFAHLGRTIYVAIAYGSHAEIVNAVNRAVESGVPVTEQSFLASLQLPFNLDLVIRTGGERRLSNFFLYQCSYAELYFSDKYFPDFDGEELDRVLAWFAGRTRRYGLLK